jgi:hypothetical protein
MTAYEWKKGKIFQIDPRENPWQCGLRWICSNCINTIQQINTKITRITYLCREYDSSNNGDRISIHDKIGGTLVAYPTTISNIIIKFNDSQTLQEPNSDIYYYVEVDFKEDKIRIIMKVDEQYNYTVYPEKVVSTIQGHSCIHEKYELSDQHHEEVKNAIKTFLNKIREEAC